MKTSKPACVALVIATLFAGAALAQTPGAPRGMVHTDSLGTPMTAADTIAARITGIYTSTADPAGYLRIGSNHGVVSVLSSRGWQSVGYFNGVLYRGVVRRVDKSHRPLDAPLGDLEFRPDTTGQAIVAKLLVFGEDGIEERWRRAAGDKPSRRSEGSTENELPRRGDYIYVEVMPEAIRKVPPKYPDSARRKGVQGTVVVQALIGKDGKVKDALVSKSIFDLDDAALDSVRKWEFKPAQSKGAPIAVWVEIPVRFTLH